MNNIPIESTDTYDPTQDPASEDANPAAPGRVLTETEEKAALCDRLLAAIYADMPPHITERPDPVGLIKLWSGGWDEDMGVIDSLRKSLKHEKSEKKKAQLALVKFQEQLQRLDSLGFDRFSHEDVADMIIRMLGKGGD